MAGGRFSSTRNAKICACFFKAMLGLLGAVCRINVCWRGGNGVETKLKVKDVEQTVYAFLGYIAYIVCGAAT